ncbi:LysR family transcriptional regulator [Lapidilactobacillus mulanensis]|uniref:LysR family transcriptional regulator n=1 Tax=Lapidilactobacillus mulanensis TaxID=2485999 RepID=A0ABW4DNI9_9LACO|nr:LysR family transcriptional regulator [Lapidilactobacillus mulanensis]
MNLSQLKGFALAAQTESITQAARLAFISQPAMSKLIQQLEEELGVTLFDRVGRTIKLSQNGQLFLSYVSTALDELQQGIDAVTSKAKHPTQPIRLLIEVASSFIPEMVRRIQSQFPETPVQLTQRIATISEPHQFDFTISTREPLKEDIAIPLINEEIFVGSAGVQINSPYINPTDLKDMPVIGMGLHSPLRDTIDNYFAQYGITLNYQYEADDPATLRELLLSNAGIGFIPATTWQSTGKKMHLARLIPNPPFRTIYLTENKATETNLNRVVANILVQLFVEQRKNSLKV